MRAVRPNPARFIFPPRSATVVPREECEFFAKMGWIAELKVNDSRLGLRLLPNDKVEFWSRHGDLLKYTPPETLLDQIRELRQKLRLEPNEWTLLDGGLLHTKHVSIKNVVALWDVIVLNGEHLLGKTYTERHGLLTAVATDEDRVIGTCKVGKNITKDIFVTTSYKLQPAPGGVSLAELWADVDKTNEPWTDQKTGEIKPQLEGLVFKQPDWPLERGPKELNNESYTVRSRVATGRHRF